MSAATSIKSSSDVRSNQSVAERIAEAFQRHGVTVVFGQSIPTAFHLAAPGYGIKQAAYRAENAGGIMTVTPASLIASPW